MVKNKGTGWKTVFIVFFIVAIITAFVLLIYFFYNKEVQRFDLEELTVEDIVLLNASVGKNSDAITKINERLETVEEVDVPTTGKIVWVSVAMILLAWIIVTAIKKYGSTDDFKFTTMVQAVEKAKKEAIDVIRFDVKGHEPGSYQRRDGSPNRVYVIHLLDIPKSHGWQGRARHLRHVVGLNHDWDNNHFWIPPDKDVHEAWKFIHEELENRGWSIEKTTGSDAFEKITEIARKRRAEDTVLGNLGLTNGGE